jgi:hypothetical protein
MFLLLSGSAGSGKTYVMQFLRQLLPGVSVRDSDEGGGARTKAERQERLEKWVAEALRLQKLGESLILVGQSPFGELLACPSAPELNSVGACLLDCHDHVRIKRLKQRGDNLGSMEMLSWACWHRMHAIDPQWRQDVIRDGGWEQLCWDRWSDWAADDPRWKVRIIDTSLLSGEEVAKQIQSIAAETVTNPLR